MTVRPVAVVLVASFHNGRCKRCGRAVVWFQTVGGSWLPFDGRPQVDRVRRDESQASAPMIGDIDRADIHWRTCPEHARERHARGSRA